jgi:hypothetical protein
MSFLLSVEPLKRPEILIFTEEFVKSLNERKGEPFKIFVLQDRKYFDADNRSFVGLICPSDVSYGFLRGLYPNRFLGEYNTILYGTFCVVGATPEGRIGGLTSAQLDAVLDRFKFPEKFFYDEKSKSIRVEQQPLLLRRLEVKGGGI